MTWVKVSWRWWCFSIHPFPSMVSLFDDRKARHAFTPLFTSFCPCYHFSRFIPHFFVKHEEDWHEILLWSHTRVSSDLQRKKIVSKRVTQWPVIHTIFLENEKKRKNFFSRKGKNTKKREQRKQNETNTGIHGNDFIPRKNNTKEITRNERVMKKKSLCSLSIQSKTSFRE